MICSQGEVCLVVANRGKYRAETETSGHRMSEKSGVVVSVVAGLKDVTSEAEVDAGC